MTGFDTVGLTRPASQLVTVFGGSGFLGRHVVRALAKRGYRIRVAVRRPDLAQFLQPLGRVGQIVGVQANLRNPASIVRATEHADIVVNLVGILQESGSQSFQRLQADGAAEIARAAAAVGAPMIHVSALGADEASASAYARSKAAAEAMLGDALAPTNRLIVARAFNHTGRGQDERFVLPSFAGQIARIEAGRQAPEMRVGNLEAARDFLDVRDVCEAYRALLVTAPGLPMRSVFNVCSGTPRRIADLLETLRGMSRTPVAIRLDEARLRPSDVPVATGANARLRDATGWAPTRPIEKTLRDLLDHARTAAA